MLRVRSCDLGLYRELSSIRAAIKVSKFQGDTYYAEAEAVELGIQIGEEAGLQSIILEIDSQVAAELINNRNDSMTEFLRIISEIQTH